MKWLTRSAWITATMALALTLVCLVTPFLPVNNVTLTIARRWLVPPKAVPDLDFLTSRSQLWTLDIGHWTPLRTLIQHASLANYNRELINWKLDDNIYRDYVLSPVIAPSPLVAPKPDEGGSTPQLSTPQLSTSSEWHRRPLWEYFYPPIRHETDPQSATQIVLKFLHERVTNESPKSNVQSPKPTDAPERNADLPIGPTSLTIDEMWRRQKADPKGFEILTVAAFRSVGIPARLSATAHPEIFVDGKWQTP